MAAERVVGGPFLHVILRIRILGLKKTRLCDQARLFNAPSEEDDHVVETDTNRLIRLEIALDESAYSHLWPAIESSYWPLGHRRRSWQCGIGSCAHFPLLSYHIMPISSPCRSCCITHHGSI